MLRVLTMFTFRRKPLCLLSGLLITAVMSGCASSPSATLTEAPTAKASARELLASHRVEKVRSYEHEIKTPDGETQWQRVEWGWDYTDAVAYELITDLQGAEIEFNQLPGVTLKPTENEMARAVAMVKAYPELAATAATPGAFFEGGFILMEPDHAVCHLKSRCVYVLASTNNGRNKIIQAIVDLQTEQMVDPNWDPSMIGSQ